MLGNIVKIIASREPSFDGTTDEVQIDFDTLKNSTLLDLQEYIVTSVEPLRQVRSQDDVSCKFDVKQRLDRTYLFLFSWEEQCEQQKQI